MVGCLVGGVQLGADGLQNNQVLGLHANECARRSIGDCIDRSIRASMRGQEFLAIHTEHVVAHQPVHVLRRAACGMRRMGENCNLFLGNESWEVVDVETPCRQSMVGNILRLVAERTVEYRVNATWDLQRGSAVEFAAEL
eukprot:SAG31_NODE_25353_length_463_cov_0.675824_1_plen_140_part_00